MEFLPTGLALLGALLGAKMAKMVGQCPHRGKVWGAFLLPLCCMLYVPLQPLALAASAAGALGAGLTAHGSLKRSLFLIFIFALCAHFFATL